MMRRRDLLILMAGTAAAVAPAASASGPPHVVAINNTPRQAPNLTAFEDELRRLGYSDGNIVIDPVITGGAAPDTLVEPVAAALARGGRIMVAGGSERNLKVALAGSRELPIVIVAIDYDPLAKGYINSLARPGGNITGVFLQQIELSRKRLDLLRQAIPDVRRGLLLWDAISADQAKATQETAAAIGLPIKTIEFRDPPYDYERMIGEVGISPGDVLIVPTSPVFLFTDIDRLAALALSHHLPSLPGMHGWVDAGGLISYGANSTEMFRLAAHYVDKLLKGAKPADLPVEQPTKFELVVNLNTAKALGLTIPPAILVRADEVIE